MRGAGSVGARDCAQPNTAKAIKRKMPRFLDSGAATHEERRLSRAAHAFVFDANDGLAQLKRAQVGLKEGPGRTQVEPQ